MSDTSAVVEDLFGPLALRHSQGRVDLAEAVVVAPALGGQPGHAVAALVAQAAAMIGKGFVVGDDHPAFAGRDLLVGIEAKDTCDAKGPDRLFADFPAKTFATVFDQDELLIPGKPLGLQHPA